MKKILSILLSLCMVVTLMPQMASAEGETANSYTCIEGTAGAGDNEGPGSLIDGKTDTKWCVTSFSSAYFIFSTASPVNVSGYSITTGDDNAKNKGRNPKNWTLYGCNATENPGRDSESWTAIHSVTDDTVLKDKNYTTYNFGFDRIETAYQYYKLEITDIQSGDVMQMSEFALTDCSHSWTSETVAPTCKEQGYTATICTNCSAIKEKKNYTSVVDHDYSGPDGACIFCGYKESDFEHTYDISLGNVIIADDDNDSSKIKVSYGNGKVVKSINPSQTITVSGSTTSYELKVETAKPVTIRAKDLSIDSSGRNYAYAMALIGGGTGEQNSADVKLILEGNNTFNGGYGKAGITVGPGKTLTIEGSGTVNAKGGNYAAGIGGEDKQSCGNIIINSGTVNGFGTFGSAGIGSGFDANSGGTIVISGGIIKGNSNDNCVGLSVDTFMTQSDNAQGGNAVIYSPIGDKSNKTNWNGILFEGDSGKVYGTSVTPTDDFSIEKGKTLSIDSGKSLLIPEDVAMVNAGTINNSGKIYVDGTFTGTADNLYYPLTLVDATANENTSEYNSKNYGKAGSTITLRASTEPSTGQIVSWNTSPNVEISGNSFIMPKEALKVSAQCVDCQHANGLTHIPAVAPTYTEYGVKEYWICSTCNMNFSDADGKNEITDLAAWKTGEGRISKLTIPKTDSVTSAKDGSVTVTLNKSITTSGSKTTAKVTDTAADQILAKLVSSESKSVVIDATAGSAASTSVEISEASLKKLAEVEGIEITLVTDSGRVVLDSKTLASVAASAGNDGQVTLNMETVENSNNLLKVDISISTSGGYVIEFNGGKVTVTVVIDDELKGRKPVAVYIDDEGKYFKIGGSLNEDGTFTFVTGHFSTYAIMPEADADKVIKEQAISAVKKVKSTVTLSTKSVKRGIKVSVKIPSSQKADKTGVIIYRSTKKNSGYAVYRKVKTSGSAYTVTNTLNVKGNRLVQGKRYYYKARVYRVIDGKTYYGPMSSVKYIRAK